MGRDWTEEEDQGGLFLVSFSLSLAVHLASLSSISGRGDQVGRWFHLVVGPAFVDVDDDEDGDEGNENPTSLFIYSFILSLPKDALVGRRE